MDQVRGTHHLDRLRCDDGADQVVDGGSNLDHAPGRHRDERQCQPLRVSATQLVPSAGHRAPSGIDP
jgi:hypothetical protein